MKTMLLILVTAGVTFASAFFIVSTQQANHAKSQAAAAQAAWDKEKAELESALAEVKGRPTSSSTAIAPVASAQSTRLSPQEIIEKLAAIHPGTTTERPRNLRQVIFYLESLVEWNTEALPDIKNFLARNEDVDYTVVEETADEAAAAADQATQSANQNNRANRRGNNRGNNQTATAAATDPNQNNQNNRGNRGNGNGNNRGGDIFQLRRGGEIRTDFVLPPSLRLGLVDVLKAIGGEAAEKILASTLETTGRGIEVAYLAHILEQMTPGKYRELAINVAKDLLTHPPTIDGNSRLDDNSKGYLYGVLAMYNDSSFAASAQTLLVGADGRIDRSALNYLNNVLKEQAVPSLYAAYYNPSMTNQFDKANIARDILAYAGNNTTANQLFNSIMNDAELDNRMKMGALAALSGFNFGPGGNNGAEVDASTYAARLPLLNQLYASTQDAQLKQMLERSIQRVSILATNGDPGNPFGGGRGGFFGNGGGNGGNRNRGGGNAGAGN